MQSYDLSMPGNDSTDRNGSDDAWRRAKRMTASPLLYVGAITIAVATEAVERTVAAGLLTEFWGTVALFPLTLVVLYAQLLALAYLRPERPGRPACDTGAAGE